MKTQRFVLFVLLAMASLFIYGPAQQQPAVALAQAPGLSIQLNNPAPLIITGSEQPQIVAQFGNRGPRINNVRVVCTWTNRIRFNGQAQNGPFANSELVVPGFNNLPSLFYPNRSLTTAAQLPDLPRGQSYNVGFGIRLQLPSPTFTGPAGSVQCSLLNANFELLAASQTIEVIVRK